MFDFSFHLFLSHTYCLFVDLSYIVYFASCLVFSLKISQMRVLGLAVLKLFSAKVH